jgi:hypothetical protein
MNEDTPNCAARHLAVWEGDHPPDDLTARRTFEDLYRHFVRRSDRFEDRDPAEPATECISAYVAALLRRWPNPTGEVNDHPAWDDGLLGNATGPLIYFNVRSNMAEEVFDVRPRRPQRPWAWSASTSRRESYGHRCRFENAAMRCS